LNRRVDVVYDVLTANYDRIMSAGGVARAADDGGGEAALKGNTAAGCVINPASDAGICIEGGVARSPADAGAEAVKAAPAPAAVAEQMSEELR
jgi:hypothetical protein